MDAENAPLTSDTSATATVVEKPTKATLKPKGKKPTPKTAPKATKPTTAAVKKAGKDNGKKDTPKAGTKKEAPKCLCGCGARTGGGRFLPGHDARLKGHLKTAFRNGGLSTEQKALIKNLGWERFITPVDAKDDAVGTLTIPQVNVLRVLNKHSDGLTRTEINKLLTVPISNLVDVIGPVDKEDLAEVEKRLGRKTLVGMKAVSGTWEEQGESERMVYKITAVGKDKLTKS